MNPLKKLNDHGQAPWLDFVSRHLIESGELQEMIERDGLRGVTSNPSIFEKAIAGGDDYDAAMEAAVQRADLDVDALFETLAVADIRAAADVLRGVYEETAGADGYVSLEVSPYLAHDTAATIADARRLWSDVDRPNLMIKVPATVEGLPAIRQLISEGINVNVTLLFSQDAYARVVEAYMAGLEQLVAGGGDPSRVASVASFFVSRIDSAVDAKLEAIDGGKELLGEVAIANAKLAYQRYLRLMESARWKKLADAGARPQRLLWASTSTKNPDYRDVLYVEQLIGTDTVNTIPPATMDAFRDHGVADDTLEQDVAAAERVMRRLGELGISIDEITDELVKDGVRKFADSFDDLLGSVAAERARFLGTQLNRQSVTLPEEAQRRVEALLDEWRRDGNVRRLWSRDASLWTSTSEDEWLGWLGAVDAQRDEVAALDALREAVRDEGFTHVLLLGMGGSSLGAEVIAETLGTLADGPTLLTLDSTDPATVRRISETVDLSRTLFIVASKSGSTLEPNVLFQYFFARVRELVGDDAGRRFVAVTDPGSKLERLAADLDFRETFFGEPSIGGRYSVLSNFGMVAAAAAGLDVSSLLDDAARMVRSCGPSVPPGENPGVKLGVALGVLAQMGRDKLTIIASPGLSTFGAWAEQLVAESTGKRGHGIIPIDLEPVREHTQYGRDRVFVYLHLESDADPAQEELVGSLAATGQPVVRIDVADRRHLPQEFFRWEIATAVAGAVLGINPFDQPDVEASKVKARAMTDAYTQSGALPAETPFFSEDGVSLFADAWNADVLDVAVSERSLRTFLAAHLDRVSAGDYVAVLAYLDRDAANVAALQSVRAKIGERTQVATALGFGPRFLHSTGQAYKGGPNSGVFIQITSDPAPDVVIDGADYTFGVVEAAQARGDFDVLAERGRRALRVHLGTDVEKGLRLLSDILR